jgi:hypothetical protein
MRHLNYGGSTARLHWLEKGTYELGVPTPSNERRRSASISRNAAQATAPVFARRQPNGLRAGLWASGRPARRETRAPAGQYKKPAPSRAQRERARLLKTPAHSPAFLIVTRMGQDLRLGSRQISFTTYPSVSPKATHSLRSSVHASGMTRSWHNDDRMSGQSHLHRIFALVV